jgi:hypothetical protein
LSFVLLSLLAGSPLRAQTGEPEPEASNPSSYDDRIVSPDEVKVVSVPSGAKKADSGEPFEYAVVELSEKSEKELDESGALGFRVVPRTIGSMLGHAGAVLERAPGDSVPGTTAC